MPQKAERWQLGLHMGLAVRINIFAGGLFCFLWGAITLGYLVQRIFRQDAPNKDSLPVEFLEQFRITDREREIILLLLCVFIPSILLFLASRLDLNMLTGVDLIQKLIPVYDIPAALSSVVERFK